MDHFFQKRKKKIWISFTATERRTMTLWSKLVEVVKLRLIPKEIIYNVWVFGKR